MDQNIAFIGGIHGSGKGTICKDIASRLNINHISASEVLKWAEVSLDVKNKLVQDITQTQNRLIAGLRVATSPNQNYLLDGHYCLLNNLGKVTRVPQSTFEQIAPVLLSVVNTNPEIVKRRLEARDNKKYDSILLSEMQLMEVEYASELAKALNTPLIIIENDIQPFLNVLPQKLKTI